MWKKREKVERFSAPPKERTGEKEGEEKKEEKLSTKWKKKKRVVHTELKKTERCDIIGL